MNPSVFFDNFSLLADSPNGVQKLREMILQLVVMGKLVPHDPNDEPVSNFITRIIYEKDKLIRARKVKLPTLSEVDDISKMKFNIPNKWTWYRLGEMVFFQEGPGIRNWQFKASGVKLLNVQNILSDGSLLLEKSDKFVSEDEFNEKYAHFLIEEGDLLFASSGGSWGKSAWFKDPGYKVMLNTSTIRLRFYSNDFESNYLKYFLDSLFFKQQMEVQLVGMQPNFGSTHLSRTYIPIPPLEEQKRIVAKVDQLMALCDELEDLHHRRNESRVHLNNAAINKLLDAGSVSEFNELWQLIYNNFDLLYDNLDNVAKLRQTILQLAVVGKLVPQDPNDEPASLLLEKIRDEKERLVKEGFTSSKKSLVKAIDDDVPYQIPNNWLWARLDSVVYNFGQKKPDVEFTYIDVASINKEKGIISDDIKVLQPKDAPSRARKIIKRGCVIYSTVRPYLLNTSIVDEDYSPEPIASTAFAVLNPHTGLSNKYLHYYLRSQPFITYVESEMVGMAYPAINDTKLYEGLIPLPPLEEQKRIVAKIDQLMALCDELEMRIRTSQEDGEKITNAVVSNLLTM